MDMEVVRKFCYCKQNVLMIMVFSLYSEEEMKRFQQELREDGAYNSVAFNYQYSAPEQQFNYPQTYSSYNPTGTEGMWICVFVERRGGGWGLNSLIKRIGVPIGNFEENPYEAQDIFYTCMYGLKSTNSKTLS